MKNIYLLAFLFLPLTLCAKIWIVDSNPGSASKDFANLQAAHDGASAGDTLYIIGSGVSYTSASVNITKRLIIIGPGFFFDNPETQVSKLPAFLTLSSCAAVIVFAGGSEGSVMMGLTIRGTIFIATNNIMIKRNHFTINANSSCNNGTRITVNGSTTYILQNYIDNPNTGALSLNVLDGLTNVFVRNNYMLNRCAVPGANCGISANQPALISAPNTGIEISNNVIQGFIQVSNAVIRNNIFPTAAFSFVVSNSFVENNMTNSSFLPAGNGNINSMNINSIFLNTGSADGRWRLSEGSPAIGAGFLGTDMGMFGGDEPYILSGIPPIPSIYVLVAPTTGEKNTGLPITIKAKSNN